MCVCVCVGGERESVNLIVDVRLSSLIHHTNVWGRRRLRRRRTYWWMAWRNLRWCFRTLAWSIFFTSFVCL